MRWGHGLDVAQLVRAHMSKLQMTQPLFLEGPVQPLDPVVHPVRAFRGHDDRGLCARAHGPGEGDVVDDDVELLLLRKLVQPGKRRLTVGPKLAGVWCPLRTPLIDHRRVRHDGQRDDRHAALAHQRGDRQERSVK
jgi:hypothetical protein